MIRYCNIIINNKSRNTDKSYCYKTHIGSSEETLTGRRVLVNFNNSFIVGLIVSEEGYTEIDEDKVKDIISVIDEEPIIDANKILLAEWIRETYLSRFNEAFSLMNPPMSRIEIFIKAESENLGIFEDFLSVNKWIAIKKLSDILKDIRIFELLNSYLEKGYVIIETRDKSFEKKIVETVHLLKIDFKDHIRKNSHKQLHILDTVGNGPVEINKLIKSTDSTKMQIRKLCEKGFVKIVVSESTKNTIDKLVNKGEVTINDRQHHTIEGILKSEAKKHLIHGVTGSGKTEVYMKIIESFIEENKSVVYLIPEISLTPQTIERFKKRFGERIAIIHSRLTSRKRMDEWLKIYNDECDIVIGPRSALFTPLKNLGVVIIDESHEDSYKS
jgi:primosomal protein N' (replication factor Y)